MIARLALPVPLAVKVQRHLLLVDRLTTAQLVLQLLDTPVPLVHLVAGRLVKPTLVSVLSVLPATTALRGLLTPSLLLSDTITPFKVSTLWMVCSCALLSSTALMKQ